MTNQAKQQLIVWWMLWATFQTGVFMFYYFLGGSTPSPESPSGDTPLWLAGLAPLAVATVIRWLVLPRAPSAPLAFPLFIVGIAMAEATSFLGLFIFPEHKQELCLLSAFGIFQFIPYFATRYFTTEDR